jgi:SWI/SNF-related matrix-associated actin-dependent regulator 1 of chromatin subfamily A
MIITSKYAGVCRICNKGYAAGARISWIKGTRGADHATCAPEGKAVALETAASRAVDADIDAPVPEGLAYMPFQRAGISYATNRKGVLIADEMGLGKTIQAIGVINADPTVRSVLVISPKSLTLNWVRELRRWLVRSFHVSRVAGPPREDVIVVVSYEEAKRWQAALQIAEGAPGWDLVVVDEAHWIKNAKAQRTKAVHAIGRGGRRRIALTGTPIANKPIELFSILQLVDPETWDPAGRKKDKATGALVPMPAGSGCGFFKFAKRYCGGQQGRWGWDFSGATNLQELQEKLRATCMVRRLKADVLTDLPAKRRQVVELAANGASGAIERERAAWGRHGDEIEDARVQVELAKAEGDGPYEEAVAKLKKVTGFAFTEISAIRHETAVAKIPYVVEHATLALEDGDGKLVIMAHHHDVIDGVMEGLAVFGAVKLTGQQSLEERQAAVDRFQKDPTCRVFVGSIMAAGVGITLTAAAHVIFAELDWVPGNVTQAEDRCHRIGQTESVLVQHLVFDDSLDARMAKVLVEKQKIADAGLDKVYANEPAVPGEQAATSGRRAELDEIATKLTIDKIAEVHAALQRLAGMCDGAARIDGAGFSKIDVRIGHELAGRARLTPRQAALGWKLARKYRRQVGVIELAS